MLIICFPPLSSLQERSAIIHRFREKRKRRVWKKKIRYFCRKNLADRRVRVKGRFVKSAGGGGVGGKSSTSSNASDSPTNTTTSSMGGGTPSRTRAVRSGSAGTDVTEDDEVRRSALTNASNAKNAYSRTYTTQRGNRTAQVQSPPASSGRKTISRAKQALQSDEESEEENEEVDEGSEEERSGDENSMEVVVGSGGGSVSTTSTISTAHTEEHKPRRFKLVLTSTDPTNAGIHTSNTNTTSTNSSDTDANFMLHLHTSPSRHTNPASNTTSIKSEEVSGVDLLASLAAKSLDESDDYDEQEDEDVFSSEMLRLPGHKRIRRHSIAY